MDTSLHGQVNKHLNVGGPQNRFHVYAVIDTVSAILLGWA